MQQCPACASSDLRVGPTSRRTERAVTGCRRCGAHFWAEADRTPFRVLPLTEMSAEGYAHWVSLKRHSVPAAWHETAARIRRELGNLDKPLVYDIGAGDGGFAALLRDHFGCTAWGNELVAGAVELALDRHGIDLELGDLGDLDHDSDLDAVTMWCVLAHVPDSNRLLRDVHRAIRPGGLLYLQTPHWTAADRASAGLQRLSSGRASRITDRRIGLHHRILHTPRSISRQLERAGFVDIVAEPVLRYPLSSRAYLASLRPPGWLLGPASRVMDAAISSRMAPRIVLDVYARKPEAGSR